MAASIPEQAERGEKLLCAYLRGSALLRELDDLGLHQAAAHLSLALDVLDRSSPSVRGFGEPAR